MFSRYRIKMIILFILVLSTGVILGQRKTMISGVVTDDNDKPLPFVNVYTLNTQEGTITGDDGSFRFYTSLQGRFTVVASMVGYKKFTQEFDQVKNNTVNLKIRLAESTVTMKEMVVSASSYSSEKEKGLVVSKIDVLTTPGGAADVFQSLKTMPGLTQVSESAELYVRGGDPIETITIIDQAPVYHPFTFESSYGGLFSNVKTSAVKNLFFSSGGFSAKYGNALSGVLEVETNGLPESARLNLGLSLANGSISASLPIIQNKLGIYFDVTQDFTKPIFWLNGGMDRMTESPNSKNATGGLLYSYSESGRIKIFTILAQEEEGVKVDRAEYNGVFDGNSRNFFINIQNQDIISNRLLMKNSLSYNRYNNLWQLGVLNLNTTDRVFSFRNDFEYMFNNNLKLLSGIEVEKRFINYDGEIPSYDYDIRPDAQSILLNTELKTTRTGVYSEVQSTNTAGIQGVVFSAGVRYDSFSEPARNWLDPRISIGYNINDKSSLRFSWGIFHQLPDLKLFRPEDGNPGLKPMRTFHYIASYQYTLDEQNSFRVETYYKKYNNLPLETPVINYNSTGYGYADGVDIIYKGNFPLGITGWISYGYISTKRQWMNFDSYANSSYDITNNLSVIAKYNLNSYLQLGLSVKYATGKPYTPAISSNYNNQLKIYVPVYAATNSGRFPDYKRVDLRITYFGQLFESNTLVIYMEGLNILDFDNIFGYTYTPDYSSRETIKSYFGRRMLVFGFDFGI